MQLRRGKLIAIAIAAGLLGLSQSSSAAPINYGDFNSPNVSYLQVTEDSTTDPTPLFGAPTLAGDALSFNPANFAASSSGGGTDTTDGTLATTIQTSGGKRIHKVSFAEAGDYEFSGSGGTVATNASVGASFFLQVVELDHVPVAPILFPGSLTITPSGGTFDWVNDPHGPAVIWTGSVTFDIDALLAGQSITGMATKIVLSLDNALVANSEANTVSTIHKKAIQGASIIVDTTVPEPASLAALALVGGLAITRRR